MTLATIVALCFITLHGPNGKDEIRVDAGSIFVVRPVTPEVEPHLAHGVKTIIYVSGTKMAVHESINEIDELIEFCEGK